MTGRSRRGYDYHTLPQPCGICVAGVAEPSGLCTRCQEQYTWEAPLCRHGIHAETCRECHNPDLTCRQPGWQCPRCHGSFQVPGCADGGAS